MDNHVLWNTYFAYRDDMPYADLLSAEDVHALLAVFDVIDEEERANEYLIERGIDLVLTKEDIPSLRALASSAPEKIVVNPDFTENLAKCMHKFWQNEVYAASYFFNKIAVGNTVRLKMSGNIGTVTEIDDLDRIYIKFPNGEVGPFEKSKVLPLMTGEYYANR
jgi:biotin-(acetyl-CoA carboxylase) ligase